MERMDKMEDAERKLELTRYLRQEQNLNRMKVKTREEILYGSGKGNETLYGYGDSEPADYPCAGNAEQGHKGPLFGLRLAICLILFAGVIYLDKNQIDWQGQSAVAVISRQLETSVMGNSTVEVLH